MKKLSDCKKSRSLIALLLLCALLMGTLLMGCEPKEEEAKCYKPVLYLYPELIADISVKLNFQGELTVTEPLYQDGWCVTAQPNGRLTAANGQTYPYLFWEGVTRYAPDRSTGYCVAGSEAAVFLADQLPKWGLNEAEAVEFIEFWQPIMAANDYQLVTFNDPNYFELADYEIAPAPDRFIRLFMTLMPVDAPVELPAPVLPSAEAIVREGFTAVEWGGALVK